MGKHVIILDNDLNQSQAFCTGLVDRGYPAVPVHSLSELTLFLQKNKCLVVFIDLDTVALDNRTIRDLTTKYPEVYFLCLSSERFHPELKEAICYHIYACINKPVDIDELMYWLRSIYENETETKAPK